MTQRNIDPAWLALMIGALGAIALTMPFLGLDDLRGSDILETLINLLAIVFGFLSIPGVGMGLAAVIKRPNKTLGALSMLLCAYSAIMWFRMWM